MYQYITEIFFYLGQQCRVITLILRLINYLLLSIAYNHSKGNMTGVTSGAGTSYPSGAAQFTSTF